MMFIIFMDINCSVFIYISSYILLIILIYLREKERTTYKAHKERTSVDGYYIHVFRWVQAVTEAL